MSEDSRTFELRSPAEPERTDRLERGVTFDRYTILDLLGSGGMGDVYAAYDSKLDRKIALKVLRFTSPDFETRLGREAHAMARLSHPNVVGVFDTGTVGGRPFLAMEFVPGTTLRQWQGAAKRSWREVVAMYVQAGRGLAAAHAAQLVHRDFKPDNVLVCGDHAKVTDFGIVRAVGEVGARASRELADALPLADSSGSPPRQHAGARVAAARDVDSGPLGTPITETGDLVGTPGYMPPEQYLGEEIEPRADQFSFCVALHDALYGCKPFAGRTVDDVIRATVEGRMVAAPKNSAVPSHVRRALLRGLQGERSLRYPSMQPLLDDLQRDPTARRRRTFVLGGVLAVTAAIALWAARGRAAQRASICSAAPALASEVWNDAAAARLEHAMLATGLPYAEDTLKRTRSAIGAYMQRWVGIHTETCIATRVSGHQPEGVMALRMGCLQQRKDEVEALLEVLSTADRDALAKAVPAALGLTPVESCRDVSSLLAIAPEPTDRATRDELQAVRRAFDAARAQSAAGKLASCRDAVSPLVDRARQLGYGPLTAEVLSLDAKALRDTGADRSSYMRVAADAVLEADRARDERVRQAAAVDLVHWSADSGAFEAAEHWSDVALVAIERLGNRGRERARWLGARAMLLERKGELEGASRAYEQAVALARADSDPLQEAHLDRMWGGTLAQLDRFDDAERLIVAGDDAMIAAFGPQHPARLAFLNDEGYVAGLALQDRRGLDVLLQAIALGESVAPDSAVLAHAYNNACWLFPLSEGEEGLRYCDKGIQRTVKAFGPDSPLIADPYASRSRILLALHRPREALADAERALAVQEKAGDAGGSELPIALRQTAEALAELGMGSKALPMLERALTLAGRVEEKSPSWTLEVARIEFELAKALVATGTQSARVDELASHAREAYDAVGPSRPEAMDLRGWLAQRHR